MPRTPSRPASRPRSLEVVLTPPDNQRLANLCGALDENLRQIEAALDVTLRRRGDRFSIVGEPDRQQRAAELLKRFYERAKRELSIDDIQLGLVEHGRRTSPRPTQPRMPTTRPRSPA